jgi:hypothetical protein
VSPIRTGTALVLAGVAAGLAVTTRHAAGAAPNDHHAAFAEYAASTNWIAVHLGQLAAGLVLLVGILALLHGLRQAGAAEILTRVGTAAAVLTAAVLTVLQGVDGIALKHAVDAVAAAPPDLHAAAFGDAETVRRLEWAMAACYRIALGLTVTALGAAVLGSRALPRWTGGLALVSGVAFLADGVGVGYAGFGGPALPNLLSWVALGGFAVTAAVAAGRRPLTPVSA